MLDLDLTFDEIKVLNVVAKMALSRFECVRLKDDWTDDMKALESAAQRLSSFLTAMAGKNIQPQELRLSEAECRALTIPLEIEYARIEHISPFRRTWDIKNLISAAQKIIAAVTKTDPYFDR